MSDEQPPTWFIVIAAFLFIGVPFAIALMILFAIGKWLVW